MDDFSFAKYAEQEQKKEVINPVPEKEKQKYEKKAINFQEIPESSKDILEDNNKISVKEFMKEESISIPSTRQSGQSTYLTLVLSPDLVELELMIRGLQYVKRYNPLIGKDEVILRKIPDHPLNEKGINQIMTLLKIYSSPEIKLGRKRPKDYYNSIQQVSHSIVRLVYKNLKNFGMDTQVKQRSAKTFCEAMIEILDASYSRSIEGKENDLSRATEFKIEGNIDSLHDPAKYFNKNEKEQLKN